MPKGAEREKSAVRRQRHTKDTQEQKTYGAGKGWGRREKEKTLKLWYEMWRMLSAGERHERTEEERLDGE